MVPAGKGAGNAGCIPALLSFHAVRVLFTGNGNGETGRAPTLKKRRSHDEACREHRRNVFESAGDMTATDMPTGGMQGWLRHWIQGALREWLAGDQLLMPWSWVLLLAIAGYGAIRLLERHRNRRHSIPARPASTRDPSAGALSAGAGPSVGAGGNAWQKGLSPERRGIARSIPRSSAIAAGGRGKEEAPSCPRCGGPVTRRRVEPAPVYGPVHIRESCGRCTWFTEKVRLARRSGDHPGAPGAAGFR